jgi:hypothetical protein
MNPLDREQLRRSLVRFLLPSSVLVRFGLATPLLLQQARAEGRRELTAGEVEIELDYLCEKGLVQATRKTVSPENNTWRITAAGRDWAAEEGIE